jgi:hypothetical protein
MKDPFVVSFVKEKEVCIKRENTPYAQQENKPKVS